MLINWLKNHQLTCSIKSTFGFECPGCGTQRSIIALLEGNVVESFRLHPGVMLFLITVIFVLIQIIFKLKNGAWYILFFFCLTVGVSLVNYIFKLIH